MRYTYLAVAALVAFTGGCRKRALKVDDKTVPGAEGSAEAKGASVAELGAGTRVAFTIHGVYEKQRPSATPPFHEAGGEWTFFDAEANGARFGFGFAKTEQRGSFGFSDAILTVPNREQGKKIVALFASRFHGAVPTEKAPQPLAPKKFGIAVFGTDMKPPSVRGTGFSGSGGGWYATKLFLQRDGLEAEVFFNFSLKDKRGEFSEKDGDYANDLVAFLAGELRDGPRPKRTPATDPSMSEHGPQIEWTRTIQARAHGLSPAGDAYWLTEDMSPGTKLVATPFDKDERTEILRVPHQLGTVKCNPSIDVCIVEDQQPREVGVSSSEDPRTFYIVDRKKQTSIEIKGPWDASKGTLPLGPAVAPDGSFALVSAYVPSQAEPTFNVRVLYVVDRSGAVRGPVTSPDESLDVVAFAGSGPSLRAILEKQKGKAWEPKTLVRSYVALDPRTLTSTPTDRPKDSESSRLSDDVVASPDGKRTATAKDGAIVVRDVTSGAERKFTIHEDDRKACAEGCVSWASPKYLEYSSNVHGFLDADTLKLNAVTAFEEASARYEYSRDFKWVAASDKAGIRFGRIVMR